MGGDGRFNAVFRFLTFSLHEFLGQVEIIPADDAVFDQAVATLGNFLFLFFCFSLFSWIADCNGAGKPVGQFYFVELFFNGLTQFKLIKIAQNEQRLYDLTESLHSFVQGMLFGI
jgi:hypothetical protein